MLPPDTTAMAANLCLIDKQLTLLYCILFGVSMNKQQHHSPPYSARGCSAGPSHHGEPHPFLLSKQLLTTNPVVVKQGFIAFTLYIISSRNFI